MASTGNPNPTPEAPTPEAGVNAGLIKTDLFRFATMRAPEIIEEEAIDNNFVKHPHNGEESNSKFLKVIADLSNVSEKKEALLKEAKTFTRESLKTKTAVKDLVGVELYEFAIWLTANRTTLNVVNTNNQRRRVLKGLNKTLEVKVWDNVFYQIITYKSGPIREVLFSVLVASFYLKKLSKVEKTDKAYQKLAQSRVVIPKELFSRETIIGNSKNKRTTQDTSLLDKEVGRIILNEEIIRLNTIKEELNLAQKVYIKTEDVLQIDAQTGYKRKIEAIYKKAKPREQTYKDLEIGIERTIKTYKDLNLPEFEYVATPELDKKILKEQLSDDALTYVTESIDEKQYTDFDEVLARLDGEISEYTGELFNNSNFNQTVVNNNGALTPVNTTVTPTASFSIYGTDTISLRLLFATDFQDAYVLSGNYIITFNDGNSVSSTAMEATIINNKLSIKLLDPTINIRHKQSLTITGEFILNNDRKIIISGTARISRYTRGLRRRYRARGKGTFELEFIGDTGGGTGGNGSSTGNTTGVLEYIPSGYGIKRLGIADYRKVEQTICCYVPGEVSHIENIMAREYKEKETRRLRRQEDTTTTSSEQEIEKLTDTTSTDRFEMNQETASVLAQDQQIGAHAEFSASWGASGTKYGLNTGADFSSSTSSEESNSQAVTYAQEVTERALDRVVQKTKEERVKKVIEEFEEKNTHGFDNRQGDSHISGVYRWVDKIYKNQVLNYGKRLMYEFMIPEPAVFHNLAIAGESDAAAEAILKPIDPRGAETLNLSDYTKITDSTYAHWAGVYNAEVKPAPNGYIQVSKAFKVNFEDHGQEGSSTNDAVTIPNGYEAILFNLSGAIYPHGDLNEDAHIRIGIGSYPPLAYSTSNIYAVSKPLNRIQTEVGVSASTWDTLSASFVVYVRCQRTPETYKQWQINTFNAIIKAYEEKLAAYNAKVTKVKDYGVNPGFYRQIENTILRKNCIAYLASHANVGKDYLVDRDNLSDFRVDYNNANIESYTALVKFFEQAFEWNIMSYNFYPFYWADKNKWKELYNVSEYNDPLHRSFLQSGMARVVITVRPGFEEAVNWYISTGQVWNGGQVPTMDDELFLSIVEELQTPEYAVEETWETRVPTSLTVIQAGAIGLNVQGLPCNTDCNDFRLFDSDGDEIFDADGNSFTNPIEQTDAQVGENSEEIIDTSGDV